MPNQFTYRHPIGCARVALLQASSKCQVSLDQIADGGCLCIAYLRIKSPSACFITCPPTSEMDLVSGMSLGQTSTQFWA